MPKSPAVVSAPAPSAVSSRQRLDASAVLRELEQLHSALQPGDAFPSRRDLLERLDAPENILRSALAEFERQGKIIRRVGRGGSIVAGSVGGSMLNGDAHHNSSYFTNASAMSHTLVVIAEPDGSIFDRALQLLVRHPKASHLAINCQLMKHEDAESFHWRSTESSPLGFLLLRRHFEPLAQKLLAQGHRVVLMGSPSSEMGAGVPNVYGDRSEGCFLIVQHLLQLGHRRLLAQIHGEMLRQVIQERGMVAEVEDLSSTQLEAWAKDPLLVRNCFSKPGAPTALIAWNDENAIRLLSLLNRAGLRVPEDVSLVGYDDLPPSALMYPALTTVDSAIERQLTSALRLLTQEQAPPSQHSVVIMPTLVPRQSTAAPFTPNS